MILSKREPKLTFVLFIWSLKILARPVEIIGAGKAVRS